MLLSEIACSVQGTLHGQDLAISSASIDTRTLKPGDLYIAIAGHNFDGHAFIHEAIEKGAVAVMSHQNVEIQVPYIHVQDTHLALAEFASAWRQKRALPVVGITGSNGKTTVKELTAAVLGVKGDTLYTQGNLNNDIGVPLTLLRLQEHHQFAVIEMGANHHGEIAYTSRFVKAEAVILNNAGAAHLEGFGSLDGVAKAKGEIIETLKPTGIAVLNRDDRYFPYWLEVAGTRRVVSFGLSPQADISAKAIRTKLVGDRFATCFELTYGQGTIEIQLNLAGKHNVLNALAAAAAGLALGLNLADIQQGLNSVKPVKGRLQPKRSPSGSLVIDDTYNANASSLEVGLDVLTSCPNTPWLVMGAFAELGPESAKVHADMGKMIKDKGVECLWAVGEDARHTVASFGEGGYFFENQASLIEHLLNNLRATASILIKGSRLQRMENVVAALTNPTGTN